MFESQPQSKCAVAYVLEKANGQNIYIAIVFSVMANQITSILSCD